MLMQGEKGRYGEMKDRGSGEKDIRFIG